MTGAAGAVPLTYQQLLMTPHQQTAAAAGFLPAQVRCIAICHSIPLAYLKFVFIRGSILLRQLRMSHDFLADTVDTI